MNSRDRNGLYGGGSIQPCSIDKEHGSRSNSNNAARVAEISGSEVVAISRPRKSRSPYARMRFAKIASMLVICAAASIVFSAIALASVVPAKDGVPSGPPARDLLPPYTLFGYTLDGLGSPVECNITVTNLRTGEFNTTNSYIVDPWPLDGYYEMDIQHAMPTQFLAGDLIKVDAVSRSGTMIGTNTVPVPTPQGGSMEIDVTINTAIPEFPTVIAPVMGMIALFAVVGLWRRREDK